MKIFIDDIRDAPDDSWILFRDTPTALSFIKANIKEITEISFDHDMGDEMTTRSIALWLEESAWTSGSQYDFVTRIHSANPIGRKWLKAALEHCSNYQE